MYADAIEQFDEMIKAESDCKQEIEQAKKQEREKRAKENAEKMRDEADSAKKNAEDAGMWFAAKERIAFVSLLSWLVVIPCALYYMMDLGSRAYAILLFKYLLWKNKKNKR